MVKNWSSRGSWPSTPRPSSWGRSCDSSEVVLKPDDIFLARSPDPEFHHPAGAAADAAKPVGGPAGYENLLPFLRPPNPLTESHLQAGIKDNPEFAPVQVVLQGERPTRPNGDVLKGSGGTVGIGPEFSPGPNPLPGF